MWELREVVEGDAAEVCAVAERIFRDTFGAQNTAADMDLYASQTFTPEAFADAIADPKTVILVAENDGEMIAYAHLHMGDAPDYITGPSPVELKRFYVLNGWHGTGLAQALMREVCARSIERGAETLWLGVWEENHRAIRFYRKLGFGEVGEMTFVLGTDAQRDLAMAIPIGDLLAALDAREPHAAATHAAATDLHRKR